MSVFRDVYRSVKVIMTPLKSSVMAWNQETWYNYILKQGTLASKYTEIL